MSTTLIEARTALHKLSSQFPAPSSYADLLATISDYLDNQVPLNVENRNLTQRVAVLEATVEHIRKSLPGDPSLTVPPKASKNGVRKGIDCTAWMGAGRCVCPSCAAVAHA
jgi:hypothetical protein